MKISVEDVSWSIGAQRIVDSIVLKAQPGEFVGLIGPNGSGKTSLLRLIYRMYPLETGLIRLEDSDIWELSRKEVARSVAVVAQERPTDFDFTVREIVMMGRTPHKGMLDPDTVEDDLIVQDALARVKMAPFAQRSFHTLSGGEKQRVLIARALAQSASIFLLDEPTNHLDIRYQLEILEALSSLGVTIIAALHDLNLAATYCNRLYLLQAGRVVSDGIPREVLTPTQIREVYGVEAEISFNPVTQQLQIAYIGVAPQT